MFRRMFEMKFLPPGRGLWAMGAPVITKKVETYLRSFPCFVDTNNITQGNTFRNTRSPTSVSQGV